MNLVAAVRRYAMNTVAGMLKTLSHPTRVTTRANLEGGDSLLRDATADALDDSGRADEASLLRSGRHVMVHQGRVHPARFTITPIARAYGRLQDHLDRITNGDHHIQWEISNPSQLLGGLPEDQWEDRDQIAFHLAGDEPNQYGISPNPPFMERYHILEGRKRLLTELDHIRNTSPLTDYLVNRVATAPIEEIDPDASPQQPSQQFHRHLARAIRRFAAHFADTAGKMLEVFSRPEHLTTRISPTMGNGTLRLALADALEEVNRHDEANLLRGDGHVAVFDGVVKPARLTMRDLYNAHWHAVHALDRLHYTNPERGLGPFSDPERRWRPAQERGARLTVLRRPTPVWAYNALVETRGAEPTVWAFSLGEGHREIPLRELRDHLADNYKQFLTERGVSNRSPLFRHVKAMRNATIEEPADAPLRDTLDPPPQFGAER